MKRSGKREVYFYDSAGVKHAREVSPETYARILKIFDGTLKAVGRNSGGLGLAMPTGLKFGHDDRGRTSLLLRIHCKDFSRNTPGALDSLVDRPKLISLSDIRPGFPMTTENGGKFLVDFGRGVLPIKVFDFITTASGRRMAVFVLRPEFDRTIEHRKVLTSLQMYWVPQECLRLEDPESALRASQNYDQWERSGEVVPAMCAFGNPLALDEAPRDSEALVSILQKTFSRFQRGPDSTDTLFLGEQGLLPFGFLEPH